jgi:hypothetical protein
LQKKMDPISRQMIKILMEKHGRLNRKRQLWSINSFFFPTCNLICHQLLVSQFYLKIYEVPFSIISLSALLIFLVVISYTNLRLYVSNYTYRKLIEY